MLTSHLPVNLISVWVAVGAITLWVVGQRGDG